MEITYDSVVQTLLFVMVMLTALLVNGLRKEILEVKKLLQQQMPPERDAAEPE